jgi:hypothetical protein
MPVTPLADAPSSQTVSYNGVTFDALIKSKLTAEPIYDRAERTVTHVKYMLQVHGFITNTSKAAQHTEMSALQTALSREAGELTLQDMGLDTTITTAWPAGTRPDIIWGCKPRLLSLEPVGHQLAWEVTWVCEFNISRCQTGSGSLLDAFMALNWDWSASINDEGLTTRRITGYYQVAAPRGPNRARNLIFNPDGMWHRLKFPVPQNFRRTSNERRFDYAKNICEFSIVDTELTGPAFPEGIVAADVDYNIENRQPGFEAWHATFSGTLTTAPGVPRSIAAQKFFVMLADKVARMRRVLKPGSLPIVESLRFGAKQFGRESTFAVTWLIIEGDQAKLFSQTGIWAPVAGSSYKFWSASMNALGVWGPRGVAKLVFASADDVIVDLCEPSQAPPTITGGGPPPHTNEPGPPTIMPPPVITREKSYVAFRNTIQARTTQDLSIHGLAQRYVPPPPRTITATRGGEGRGIQAARGVAGRVNPSEYHGHPEQLVVMYGKSMRLRFQPTIPEIASVGGVAIEEVSRVAEVTAMATFGAGVPLYMARWEIVYRVNGLAQRLDPPDNPLLNE